jgi:hypothetical protein
LEVSMVILGSLPKSGFFTKGKIKAAIIETARITIKISKTIVTAEESPLFIILFNSLIFKDSARIFLGAGAGVSARYFLGPISFNLS